MANESHINFKGSDEGLVGTSAKASVRFTGNSGPRLRSVALLGSFVPRQCGIATFTCDLAEALGDFDPALKVDVIAMSDRPDYAYDDEVVYQIPQNDLSAYADAAEFLNRGGYDVLSVQHEFGIFGGEAGSHLLGLVRKVNMPIVTTVHTVLDEPSPQQRAVFDELMQLSERVVTMSTRALRLLGEVHGVPADKIDLIPHGIPDMSAADGSKIRAELGLDGPMILTFGLLSPDKGIEFVIGALPKIVERHPDLAYVVVGATHPNIRASRGEGYRESLVKLAEELGVSRNLVFVDRFVETTELVDYLAATEIYITPYLNPKQATSGTLAYSMGAGKAVVSTPYAYAAELLDEGRGRLVKFRDSASIAEVLLELLDFPEARQELGRRAAEYASHMVWPEIGGCYLDCFAQAKLDSATDLRSLIQHQTSTTSYHPIGLPADKLDHLIALSDDTGIIQHATHSIPNRSEGYCVDDNARALLFTAYLESAGPLSPQMSLLQSRYLAFVLNAYNPEAGRFRNFMSYSREWLEDVGSNDSQGRSLWALGAAARRCREPGRRDLARSLFSAGLRAVSESDSLRTWGFGVLAAEEFLQTYPADGQVLLFGRVMAERIWTEWQRNACEDWPWFEQDLTYGNARLSQALIVAGQEFDHPEMLEAGLKSLEWLMQIQTGPSGVFAAIGCDGFYVRGGERSCFDQQPIEAWASVSACLAAERIVDDGRWLFEAHRAFRWFLGENMLGAPMIDTATGGCYDGLHADSVNRNQGAESTLAYLCAAREIREALRGSKLVSSETEGYRLL